jgi:hypothetical protein
MDLDEALKRIDAAVDRSDKQQGSDKETLEAMHFLWRLDADRAGLRDALIWFNESLAGNNRIGRFQNANASRNRIRFLVGRT